jgi:hypothetical protein
MLLVNAEAYIKVHDSLRTCLAGDMGHTSGVDASDVSDLAKSRKRLGVKVRICGVETPLLRLRPIFMAEHSE